MLVLILNCIHGNKTRAYVLHPAYSRPVLIGGLFSYSKMLTSTTAGIRVCISLLDDLASLYDADDSSEGARAFDVG